MCVCVSHTQRYRYTYILKLDTICSPPFTLNTFSRYVVVFVTLSVVFFSANTKVGQEQGPPGPWLSGDIFVGCWLGHVRGWGLGNPCNKVYIHAYSRYVTYKYNIILYIYIYIHIIYTHDHTFSWFPSLKDPGCFGCYFFKDGLKPPVNHTARRWAAQDESQKICLRAICRRSYRRLLEVNCIVYEANKALSEHYRVLCFTNSTCLFIYRVACMAWYQRFFKGMFTSISASSLDVKNIEHQGIPGFWPFCSVGAARFRSSSRCQDETSVAWQSGKAALKSNHSGDLTNHSLCGDPHITYYTYYIHIYDIIRYRINYMICDLWKWSAQPQTGNLFQ